MKQFLFLAVLLLGAVVAQAQAPKKASAPDYKTYGPTAITNAATVYHTLATYQSNPLWYWDASTFSVQIKFDETSGAATTTVTLQGTNQLDAASPTWVDVWSPAAWTADEDTLISITPVYGLYRLKFAQTGTATSTVQTDWIIE